MSTKSEEIPSSSLPGSKTSKSHSHPSKTSLQKQSEPSTKITHKSTKYVKLEEDFFGFFTDTSGKIHNIRRFTWTNHNCISAQIITYGARIISLKLPNRKCCVDDIVLGFNDINSFLCNGDLPFGAILGRVAGKVEKGTCVIKDKQYWLSANDGIDHCDGGFRGFDKVIWTPSVEDSKVILSYVSRDMDEGYPGDLFIRVAFELSTKNEFTIDMEAFTTKHTIVNLSNLLYFNLGGHWSGPQELYKHIVNINANCYLPLMDNGLPSGEILNVIYTKNDFQVPKVLKNEIGIEPDDGYDEHMCVNRGIHQGLCFVARALHPPSGRILEMYSNQCGVRFSTANHFGYGALDVISPAGQLEPKQDDDLFQLIEKLHSYAATTISIDSKTNFEELNDLITKLHKIRKEVALKASTLSQSSINGNTLKEAFSEMGDVTLTPMQVRYLKSMIDATKINKSKEYEELEKTIKFILDTVSIKDEYILDVGEIEEETLNEELEKESEKSKSQTDSILKKMEIINLENAMGCCCKDGRIHGKNNSIYKRHGAMCFQSENYPNAIYHKNFPNCELRPGEAYRHTIVYKFWIQSGDPNKWLRRNVTLPRN